MKLVPRICQAYAYQRSLGHEGIASELALHVRDRIDPDTRAGNYTARVRARSPEAIEELLSETERVFVNCPHRLFACDPTTPPEFVARLVLDGYQEQAPTMQLSLGGPLTGARQDVSFVPVDDPGTWHRLAVLFRLSAAEGDQHGFMAVRDRVVDRRIAEYREKAPSYRMYLAVANGEDHGYYGRIVCGNRVGIIGDMFVCPSYRRLGVGRAVLQDAVMRVRSEGALVATVSASPASPLVQLCLKHGFMPACVSRDYVKMRGAPHP